MEEPQRDEKGRLTAIKINIRVRKPMSEDGFKRWGIEQRMYIAKSRLVWKHFASSKDLAKIFPPEGRVPVTYLMTDKALGNFLIDFFQVGDGETYALQQWSHGKTKTHIKWSKHLAEIRIINAERRQFEVSKSGALNTRWFRREGKERHR